MIAIKVGEEFLDLYPDTRLRIEFESRLLDYDAALPQSYSLPFTVPDTQKNRRIFQHLHLLNSATTQVDIRGAQLLIARTYYRDCTISCRKYSNSQYFIALYLNDSAVWDLMDFRLRLLISPVAFWDNLTEAIFFDLMDATVAHTDWQNQFVFPQMIAQDFLPGNGSYSGLLNAWQRQDGKYERTGVDNTYDAWVPVFFLKHVLSEALQSVSLFGASISTEGDWWDEPGTGKMLLFNNYTISRFDNTLAPDYIGGIVRNNHVPDITLKELVKQLCTTFNLVFRYDGTRNVVQFLRKSDILESPPERDLSHAVLRAYEGEVDQRAKFNFSYGNDAFPSTNIVTSFLNGVMPPDVTFQAAPLVSGGWPIGSDPPQFEWPILDGQGVTVRTLDNTAILANTSTTRMTAVRLGYWRGLTNPPPPYVQEAYPHAAHYLGSPTDLADNFDLNYLLPYRFGRFQTVMQGARRVKMRFKFSLTDFLNFDIYKVYRIANVDFFVDRYVVELDQYKREIEVEAELWRL